MRESRFVQLAASLGLAIALAACAAPVRTSPARISPVEGSAPDLVIAEDLPIRFSTGYTRTVAGGSRWRAYGRLPQGLVYQPVGSVFAIEGRQVHEAYLVLRDGAVHGFYLPGEQSFSPLDPALSLPLAQGAK